MEYASGIMPGTSFVSFQAAIEYVFKLCENERLVLVIDEYPYVAKASKSMASTLQMLIDKNKDNSKMMLIYVAHLCLTWKIMCWRIRHLCMAEELPR